MDIWMYMYDGNGTGYSTATKIRINWMQCALKRNAIKNFCPAKKILKRENSRSRMK